MIPNFCCSGFEFFPSETDFFRKVASFIDWRESNERERGTSKPIMFIPTLCME